VEDKQKIEVEISPELSNEALRLIAQYKEGKSSQKSGSVNSTIKVSQVLGPLAFIYERVRNAVEYKGEHLIRRNAIERILRRQIWERKTYEPALLAETLMKELIWARYIKNDFIPKRKLKTVEFIVAKYLGVFASLEKNAKNYNYADLKDWFLGTFSAEIEEALDENIFYKEALNYCVFSWFKKNYVWVDSDLDEEEKDIQIFIALHRSLSKSDKAGIRYRLLKVYFPEWIEKKEFDPESDLNKVIDIERKIERQITSSYQPKMYRFVQRHSAAFLVLKEIIDKDFENIGEIFESPKNIEEKVTEVCKKKYGEIGKRVSRGIVRSIVYIFLTKVFLAILIEMPYEIFVKNKINFLPLGINIIFPPFLMFMVGLTIRRPDEDNTQRIISIIKSFVYKEEHEEKIEFSLVSNSGKSLIYRIFFVVYLLLFLLTFGGITLILFDLGFNIISAGIFFIFLSLVLLFGYRIRYTATELNVRGEKESFLAHLVTNIALPLLNLGSWLSQGLQKFNFLLLFMDFLIEAPLKNIIRVFEEWTSFIKEKREEVIEVPN
jgi:hypothetical protein